jgi:hypothetical protein
MPARKKKAARKLSKRCLICGGPHDGKGGDVCASCLGTTNSGGGKRVAEAVRNRIHGTVRGGFICPFCRCELSWETIKTSEIEVTIYVREKIYYCPSCRGFLGVSSWHTEG